MPAPPLHKIPDLHLYPVHCRRFYTGTAKVRKSEPNPFQKRVSIGCQGIPAQPLAPSGAPGIARIKAGTAFGLMLQEIGYNFIWAFFMSLTIYAGSGQYLGVTLLGTGAALGTVAVMTLLINFLGSVAIGAIVETSELAAGALSREAVLFLKVGLCGGFTTFSTFVHENFSLFQNGNLLHFILYTTLSFGLGLAAACLGHLIVKIF